MKKLFTCAFAMFMALFQMVAVAQQLPPVPVDPAVRIGVLDNGLTYYIRHNDFNEGLADFYIAQKVGSILEEDDQRGLAHFLEHMCFNGTDNFKGNDLISYLETIGVKFGANLNAYTSIDETVYNICNVPVSRSTVVDTCLLILRDWADGLTLDPEEIDKERGVIHEEWRLSMGAMMRMYESAFPEIFPGSKYAYRLPIGTMEVVDNFPYQALRDYYEKWYRPDLQGIIVVGDIDVDAVEAKIIELFSGIEMPAEVAEREYFPVPDNIETIVTVQKDKEQINYQIELYRKHDVVPVEERSTIGYLLYVYMLDMATDMLNARFNELLMKPGVPFMAAMSWDDEFILAKTKGAFTALAVCDAEGVDSSLAVVVRETERVRRYGFTAAEYDRARNEYLSKFEKTYNNRDKQKNSFYTWQYVRHFIDNIPIPSTEDEYELMSQTVRMIPVDAINSIIPELITESNIVAAVYCPDKEGMPVPTKEEVMQIIEATMAEDIEPYVDDTPTDPLMSEDQIPAGGSIVSVEDGVFDSKVLTLSNGIKVIVKDTDFKADDILFSATSWGGETLVADEDLLDASLMTTAIELGGLAQFSAIDLQKVLSGKQASMKPELGNISETLSGHSTTKDFETMLQLLYLSFYEPRRDDEAVQTQLNLLKSSLLNRDVNPHIAFSDSLSAMLYDGHPRFVPSLKAETVDKISYDNIIELYKQRFADPGDFTYFLVGNLDGENVNDLIAKYIGGLQTAGVSEQYDADKYLHEHPGKIEKTFARKMEIPQTTVIELYIGDLEYTQKTDMAVDIIGQLLRMRYTETIREEMGGTYSVFVQGQMSDLPTGRFMMQIYFSTDPDKADMTVKAVRDEIDKLIAEGPDAEDFAKVKEYMAKKHSENIKENSYWLRILKTSVMRGRDEHTGYLETLESIDSDFIVEVASEIFAESNKKQLIMAGE